MAEPYEVKRIDEVEGVDLTHLNMTWRPIRRTLGITAFGMNAYTGDTGRQVVEPHEESTLRHEEVYVVLSGLAQFKLGDDEIVARPGTIVYLRDPDTRREAVALEDGTTVLAVGGRPGEAYQPSAWEWFFAARPLREKGHFEGALALIREGLKHHPSQGGLLYNVARYEALLGRPDDALASLRLALEADPSLAEWARGDADFASVTDDPEFLAITGQADAAGSSA
jgi:tetratricopeptide (TPR) repeat protein